MRVPGGTTSVLLDIPGMTSNESAEIPIIAYTVNETADASVSRQLSYPSVVNVTFYSSPPTSIPISSPSGQPSGQPTSHPSQLTGYPSEQPSSQPSQPSGQPTAQPTNTPTTEP